MSIAVIGGKLYINHLKNTNHVHKDSNKYMSFLITLGTNISGLDTVFYDGVIQTGLEKIFHTLKHLYDRIIINPFEICFHEGSL